jgi:integrase
LLQEFVSEARQASKQERQRHIYYASRLWAEEKWLNIYFVPIRIDKPEPNIKVIPEEILVQVYNKFDLLPPMLERLFRLQFALGWRISEMLVFPRQCLKREGEQWFVKRWIGKRKVWKFHPIHQLIAELIQEQQRFLDEQFGTNSVFDKLFCWISTTPRHGAKLAHPNATRFETDPVYQPKLINRQCLALWLRAFSKVANLQDKHGNSFTLTSHLFRRTKASVMAYCETEDEYIAATLGHASLDMLPHYRQRSLERLEKESQAKGYVDMYGRVTTFKPNKRRYEQLAHLMKVSTPLGECHRPKMLGDCQYRYACLRCDHHRVTPEDKPKLEADLKYLQGDLEQAQASGAERRVTEINQLKELIGNRLQGLEAMNTLIQINNDVS